VAYLDHNATSPLRPEAMAAMEHAAQIGGNASAIHHAGRAARAVVENARGKVATLLNAMVNDVVFTSGGSEANALALWGAVHGAAQSPTPITRLLVSAIEHDSVRRTSAAIVEQMHGLELAIIPVKADGTVDVDALQQVLVNTKGRSLVAVMAANNETGVVQPMSEVAERAHAADALCLVDAAQACGKMTIDFAVLGADYLTVSAHKFGGPQGTGALVVRANAPFASQMPGGQEKGRRAGTENVMGIAGFGAAAECVPKGNCIRIGALRDRFETALKSRFPETVIFGEASPRLANTSNFAIPGLSAETAVIALDLDGVMVSSGAACSSGKVQTSHVLKAMDVPRDLASCGLRVSFGWNSDDSELDGALDALDRLVARIRERKAA
jgi:cysteine desulfurase